MAEREPKAGTSGQRPDITIAPDLAPSMQVYADISRMLFRMHRNVSAHMDANKRLAERMQSVFSHEQAMVMELAKLIDQSMSLVPGSAGAGKPVSGGESIERIFDHARNAMEETGRMMTQIQLESLALLQHYVTQSTDGVAPVATKADVNKETDKK